MEVANQSFDETSTSEKQLGMFTKCSVIHFLSYGYYRCVSYGKCQLTTNYQICDCITGNYLFM